MAQAGTQVYSILTKVLKCLDCIRDIKIGKDVKHAYMTENKGITHSLNRYIEIKDDIEQCLEFLSTQFLEVLGGSANESEQAHGFTNKIQATDNKQKSYIQDTSAFGVSGKSFDNKLCIAQTSPPMLTTREIADLRNVIANRQEVKLLKEKLQKDTKLVLIEELVEPVKRSLESKEFREKQLVDVLVQRNADLIDRLAAEMNARISADERDLENINIRNRPMNVAEEYTLLMSNAWLEAKCSLDEITGEQAKEAEKHQFFSEIITEAYVLAQRGYERAVKELGKHLKLPMEYMFNHAVTKALAEEEKAAASLLKCTTMELATTSLPNNVLCCIGDYMRVCADYVKLEDLCKEIETNITTKSPVGGSAMKTLFMKEQVGHFVKECARLAWKMVIQRPPMVFGDMDLVDKPWKAYQQVELVWGSTPDKKGAVVRYYKQPVLLHGDKMMAKGAVFVG